MPGEVSQATGFFQAGGRKIDGCPCGVVFIFISYSSRRVVHRGILSPSTQTVIGREEKGECLNTPLSCCLN
jgi:hypothetical protein